MSPAISKDSILDAAEAIVCESGAAHMTLDGVAERAQVSKGGLMYSFPTKSALLQGMIRRLIEHTENLREQVRQRSDSPVLTELMVEIEVMSLLDEEGSRPTAAVLAAIANEPDLIDPFMGKFRKRLHEKILSGKDLERDRTLFLAAMGLHLATMLNIPLLEPDQRREAYEGLLRLAAHAKERL